MVWVPPWLEAEPAPALRNRTLVRSLARCPIHFAQAEPPIRPTERRRFRWHPRTLATRRLVCRRLLLGSAGRPTVAQVQKQERRSPETASFSYGGRHEQHSRDHQR